MSRRWILKAAGVSVLLGLVVLVVTTLHPVSGREVRRKNEVVMMRCDPGPHGFQVTAYSHSQSAPSRRSDNCPEALSLLNHDGFRVLDIARFDMEGGYLVYTLMR
jgi:hypothetical protein